MTIIQSIVLGIVQGITEFLPVSSSGHLAIFPYLFNWEQQSLAFDTTVHLGTLLAIIIYFRKEVVFISQSAVVAGRKIINKPEILLDIENFNGDRLPVLLVLGTIPVAVAGLLLGDQVSDATSNPYIVATVLILFGVIMWFADDTSKVTKKLSQIDVFDTLTVGAMQALALVRGISRSGATITAGRYLGYSRESAAKFSFLLSIPAIALAGVYQLFQVWTTPGAAETMPMLIGFVTSFVAGFLTIKFFMSLVSKVGMAPFVLYRIILGIALFIFALYNSALN